MLNVRPRLHLQLRLLLVGYPYQKYMDLTLLSCRLLVNVQFVTKDNGYAAFLGWESYSAHDLGEGGSSPYPPLFRHDESPRSCDWLSKLSANVDKIDDNIGQSLQSHRTVNVSKTAYEAPAKPTGEF